MDNTIFFFTRRKEDEELCAKIAKKLNFKLVPLSKIEDVQAIKKNARSAVFVSVDDEKDLAHYAESDVYKALDALSKILPSSRVFALADKMLFELPHLFRNSAIGNYLLRRYDSFCLDWIPKVVLHAIDDHPLDLQGLKDPGAKEVKIKLTHSDDRPKALKGVENLLAQKKFNERAIHMILQALDELILNAIFDAPMDDKGRTYRKANPRNSELLLFDREEVEVGIVLNENSFLLRVLDHFGSFSKDRALKIIQKDYASMGYKADANTQSAGLGLHEITGSGLGFLIDVRPGKYTEAVLAFPHFKSFKDMRNSFRSFSIMIQPFEEDMPKT